MKKNIKIILCILIGLIIGSSIYAFADSYLSNQITFDNSTSTGLSTNVQSAIEELYTMTNTCTQSANLCATVNDAVEVCGEYSACSVSCDNETGTKERTCHHEYYSATSSAQLCSVSANYTDTAECNGTQTCGPSWHYLTYLQGASSCLSNCNSFCKNMHSATDWKCEYYDSTGASTNEAKNCWCYY